MPSQTNYLMMIYATSGINVRLASRVWYSLPRKCLTSDTILVTDASGVHVNEECERIASRDNTGNHWWVTDPGCDE